MKASDKKIRLRSRRLVNRPDVGSGMNLRKPLPPTCAVSGALISHEQLAHDADIDRAYHSRVEPAVTYVGLEIIGKLAETLEVDATEFFQKPPKR